MSLRALLLLLIAVVVAGCSSSGTAEAPADLKAKNDARRAIERDEP